MRWRLPLFVAVLVATLPLWLLTNQYLRSTATLTLLWIAAGIAWNVLGGFGGQLSLGHGVFFGLGAYGLYFWFEHVSASSAWLGVPVIALLAAVVGLPMVVAFRLRGVYFALVTFAVVTIIQDLAGYFSSVTNGPDGVSLPLVNGGSAPSAIEFSNPVTYFYIALGAVVLYGAIAALVRRSSFGLRLRAIRDDEVAARSNGVKVIRVKVAALLLSAWMVAVVGALYMATVQFIDPASGFGPMVITQTVVAPMAGGLGTLWGPALGAGILYPLQQAFSNLFPNLAGMGLVVYGAVVALLMRLEPRGFVGVFSRVAVLWDNGINWVARRRSGEERWVRVLSRWRMSESSLEGSSPSTM